MKNINEHINEIKERTGFGRILDNKKKLILSLSIAALYVYTVRSTSYRKGYEIGRIEGYNRGVDSIIDLVKREREDKILGIS